jgi:gamma-glutamylputrescine oxidase
LLLVSPVPDLQTPGRGVFYSLFDSMQQLFAEPQIPGNFPLTVSVDADVCVIGGGLTGVSAALHLAELGLTVVLLERASLGSGATTISAGHIVSGFLETPAQIARKLGPAIAARLHRLSREGTERLKQRLLSFDNLCGYREGYLFTGLTAAHESALTSLAAFWQTVLGHPVRYLTRSQLPPFFASSIYRCGVYDPASGSLDPAKLLFNLAETAKVYGCRIYEYSRARRISRTRQGRLVVETAEGAVNADHVVLGGNFNLEGLTSNPTDYTAETTTSVIVTESIDQRLMDKVSPDCFAGSDWRDAGDYWTVRADNKLLFGGSPRSPDPERGLLQRLRQIFPELSAVKASQVWSGRVDHTRNKLPRVRRQGSNLWIAHGYNGVGLSLAYLAGSLIAAAIAGNEDGFLTFEAICHRPFRRWPAGIAA